MCLRKESTSVKQIKTEVSAGPLCFPLGRNDLERSLSACHWATGPHAEEWIASPLMLQLLPSGWDTANGNHLFFGLNVSKSSSI